MSSADPTRILWQASDDRVASSGISQFMKHSAVSAMLAEHPDYRALHQWSCEDPSSFWAALAEYCSINFVTPPTTTLQTGEHFLDAQWFPGATLNIAEHMLRCDGPHPAIIAHREGAERQEISWPELRRRVAAVSRFLLSQGLLPGDRVAAIMPNVPETLIVMLAVTAIGGIWSSCSPDFGTQGVLDRFKQIEPRWLLACDGYIYNNKPCQTLDMVANVASSIPSLEGILMAPIISQGAAIELEIPAHDLAAIIHTEKAVEPIFLPMPFDHPMVIAYSSGTTGLPKAIVHRAGGILLQHMKEHQLHVDVKPGDRFFYFTTCGWMMWNWLVSGLASQATLILYDGSPFAGSGEVLLNLIEEEEINIFGVGAKYLQELQKQKIEPNAGRDLSSLKTILSTGSPLSEASFDFVYEHFGSDIHLASISGGTDLLSCFVGGVPTLPVRRGLIQAAGLAMDVQVWNDAGERIFEEPGELVCTQPFPTVPLGFWHDKDNERFLQSYFSQYPGIWCQADFAEESSTIGFRLLGRSDTVLNPGGVRIGTAEIYRQIETIEAVTDSVVIGQPWQDDVRVVLFVVMATGYALTPDMIQTIKHRIRAGATPRHTPSIIVAVDDIPRTISGKIAEKAVLHTVMGKTVSNLDALSNPDALKYFNHRPELEFA